MLFANTDQYWMAVEAKMTMMASLVNYSPDMDYAMDLIVTKMADIGDDCNGPVGHSV